MDRVPLAQERMVQFTKEYSPNPSTPPVSFVDIMLPYSSHSISQLLSEVSKHRNILAYYMVPALLYCLYNNLSFVNLSYFDPTTYFMFMQIRLLLTGIMYQVS